MAKNNIVVSFFRLALLLAACFTTWAGYGQNYLEVEYSASCVGSNASLYWNGNCDVTWSITGPYQITSQTGTSLIVSWTAPGGYTVTANSPCGSGSANFTVQDNIHPTVSISGPTSFAAGTSVTYTATVTNAGNAPTYYWYVNGTQVSGQNGKTFTTSSLNNGNTVYVGLSTGIFCTSPYFPTSNTITVSVTYPISPPTTSPVSVLAGTSTVLTASGATAPETYRWYDNNGPTRTLLAQGTTFTTPVLSTDITYYVSKYSPLTNTESGAVPLVVTLYVNPPGVPVIATNTCGPRTLTRGTPPAGVVWYWQGTNAAGTSTSSTQVAYTVSTSGTYYLRARITQSGLWSTATGVKVDIDPTDVVVNAYDPTNNVIQATHSVTLGPGFILPAGQPLTINIVATPECNDNVNWSEESTYGEDGALIGQTRTYYSGQGRTLQVQSKDMVTNEIMATQSLYDRFGEEKAVTLPAPILSPNFLYRNKFTSNAAGQPYGVNDFDRPITTAKAAGEVYNPKPVGEASGTVGWYYSGNNYLEPQTPVTDYPYVREYSPAGPDPLVSTAAIAGDAYKMGSGHESKTERQPLLASELSHYLSLKTYFVSTSVLTYAGTVGYKIVSTDPNGKKIVSFTDFNGWVLATATLAGTTYDRWAYHYYNDAGQLVASVAPKGVIVGNTSEPSFVTRYKYNNLGRVIETSSPDAGTVQYVYSTDGKIRFSQNQLQRAATPKRFSYTNYDELGRPIESGEYISSTVSGSSAPYVFEPQTTATPATTSVLKLIDMTGATGVSKILGPAVRYVDYSLTTYDVPAADLPAGDANHATQEFLAGTVAKTENAIGKTWYSYDEYGNIQWTKQSIDGLGYKTIDYTYDYAGNITSVAYQRGQADAFYHHYVYDKSQQLAEVYTSKDGVNKTLRGKYAYYLHGPVKRVELGDKVQGIDYVYTIDGSLKLINHADPNLDPGADGLSGVHADFQEDAFGEVLDYNISDYTGAGYNEKNFKPGNTYPDQFNGLVKSARWHSAVDDHVQRAYAYQYDDIYQLDNADWGSVTAGAITLPSGGTEQGYVFTPSATQSYQEDMGNYDKNGNIGTLVRRGKAQNLVADYTYTYKAGKNQLERVDHQGVAQLSYLYDDGGQMIQQTEGTNVLKMEYNAWGLISAVKTAAGVYVQLYRYDDRGERVVKEVYNSQGVATGRTYYKYDADGNVIAIYEQALPGGTPELAEVPVYGASRIALYKPAAGTCFYEVNDHVGNVRAVIGVPDVEQFTATLEAAVQRNESAIFDNYRATDADLFDHTDAGTGYHYSHLLNGGYSGQVGLAKSFRVSPGDRITASVYAKYKNLSSTRSNVTAFASALTAAFGLTSPATIDGNMAREALNRYGSVIAAGNGPGSEATGPKAFVNILILDASYNLVDAGWDQLGADFDQPNNSVKAPHDLLTQELIVKEPGYAYVFVSNENSTNVDVYFDDMQIQLAHSPVVAGADYYPFGMVMEEREITVEPYRYGYQGQFSEKDLTTGMQAFDLRMYNPKIGRWTTGDPYGQYSSPYVGMGNNPVTGFDPDGGFNWGATAVGAGAGFVVGSAVGLAVDKDNWWKYGLAGAAVGGVVGATTPDLTIARSASGWEEFRAEIKQAVLGGEGSIVSGKDRYFYAPGLRGWKTLASINVPDVRQMMSQWCVFGCSESLNRFFGGHRNQTDFSRSYNNGNVVDRGVTGDLDYGSYYVRNFRTGENGRDLPQPDRIKTHLKRNNPISIKVDRGRVNGQRFDHNMIIKGIQQNLKTKRYRLMIMDPAGKVRTQTYRSLNRIHRYFFVILGI